MEARTQSERQLVSAQMQPCLTLSLLELLTHFLLKVNLSQVICPPEERREI